MANKLHVHSYVEDLVFDLILLTENQCFDLGIREFGSCDWLCLSEAFLALTLKEPVQDHDWSDEPCCKTFHPEKSLRPRKKHPVITLKWAYKSSSMN